VISGDTHTPSGIPEQLIIRTITFHFSEMFMCYSPAVNIFLPSRVPIHSNNEARPKKQKLLAQFSYPNQFATAIVTSAGALIAALKAREIEKVSQGCPFNRIG
jgi:hypothetical protein